MREESHLDDMRSAIRGDFERLAERRGAQELMSVDDDPPAPPEFELAPEQVAPEPEPADDKRPASWLDRLLGR